MQAKFYGATIRGKSYMRGVYVQRLEELEPVEGVGRHLADLIVAQITGSRAKRGSS